MTVIHPPGSAVTPDGYRNVDREQRVRRAGDVIRMDDGRRQQPVVVEWALDPEAVEWLLEIIPDSDQVHGDLAYARQLARDLLWQKVAGR